MSLTSDQQKHDSLSPHLHKIWNKALHGAGKEQLHEAELHSSILDILGLGILPTYQYLYTVRPNFNTFEQWVTSHFNGAIPEEKIKQCDALINGSAREVTGSIDEVLTKEDILSWESNGYVILKQAISKDDCEHARAAIFHHLQMDEDNPQSWYTTTDALQGIMVTLYDDPTINKNRNNPRIKAAFQQLWHQHHLISTADKCGFNPPETNTHRYRGIGLHWDVSLVTPVPFGTQGILYLTDTTANQGALTVVPGFHQYIDQWLKELPEHVDPRNVDLSSYHPVPIAANAGDLIIWDQRLPHGGSPNTASTPRVVQYINWYSPSRMIQDEWK